MRLRQARSSTWPRHVGGLGPATLYFWSTTKNGTPVAPYATACRTSASTASAYSPLVRTSLTDLVEPDLGGHAGQHVVVGDVAGVQEVRRGAPP